MFSKKEDDDRDITPIDIVTNPEAWHGTILDVQHSDANCAEIIMNFRSKYLIKDLEDWLECWKKQRDDAPWIPVVPPIDDVIQAAETLLVFFNTDFAAAKEQFENDKPH